jgi:hypothetical protein
MERARRRLEPDDEPLTTHSYKGGSMAARILSIRTIKITKQDRHNPINSGRG